MIQLRNQTFYFRQTIPKRLQSIVSSREIYYSLRTKDRSIAELKVAQVLPLVMELKRMAASPKLDRKAVNQLIDHFRQRFSPQDDLSIELLNGELAYLDDCMSEIGTFLSEPGSNRTIPENYVKPDHGSKLAKELFQQLGYSELSSRTRFEVDKALHAACDKRQKETINALYGTSAQSLQTILSTNPTPSPIQSSPRISELAKSFIEKKRDEQKVAAGTIAEYEGKLRVLAEITGDMAVSEIDAYEADRIRDTLRKLPANRKKKKEYQGKSLAELVAMKCPPMAETTVQSHLATFKVFHSWCSRYYTDIPANPFIGMLAQKRGKKESEERESWSRSDLKKLFSSKIYSGSPPQIKYQYWLPLLGLYTGARLNELCQLMATDITEVDGIWCIYVNDQGDRQKLKNANSRRFIPIHSKLIELGFIDYAKSRKDQRLFSNLNHSEKAGFGAYPSRWFARYRDSLGLTATFHGLRHTFANEFKQMDEDENKAGELLGHKETQGISYGRYSGDFSVKILKETIELLNFDDFINQAS